MKIKYAAGIPTENVIYVSKQAAKVLTPLDITLRNSQSLMLSKYGQTEEVLAFACSYRYNTIRIKIFP